LAEILERYRDIVHGRVRARFLDAGFAEKRRRAAGLASPCRLCERKCGADRKGGKAGACGVLGPLVSSEFLHYGEEPELVPSHTIFFAGCTFKCAFCQNHDISQEPACGVSISPAELANRIERGGGINVNWVGGDPTSNLEYILAVMEALKALDRNIAQVWNSNMYLSQEAMAVLDGVIDVHLSDFKYGNDRCAKRLSGVDRYFEVVSRNHLVASGQCEILLRHLVMPGHVGCCTKPVLEWAAANLPKERLKVNLMDQYHPDHMVLREKEKYPELGRRLKMQEFLEAYEYARKLGLDIV
jgi:putative pyruvate formate lyase activating enzyme